MTWKQHKEATARHYFADLLARHAGNVTAAAKEAGMLRQALQRLLRRHGIQSRDYRSEATP